MSFCDCAQDKQKRNKGAADEPDVDCRERSALAERELILFCDIIRGIKNFLARLPQIIRIASGFAYALSMEAI